MATSPMTEFEAIKSEISNIKYKRDKADTKIVRIGSSKVIFETLKEQNNTLDSNIIDLQNEILVLQKKNKDDFSKNLTFSLAFNTISTLLEEYRYQSTLFAQYSNLYDEMCNEENLVKILDILRMILTERKNILNDVLNNVIKLQRLANDRIKIDINTTDENNLIDDIINPDTI